MRLLILLFLFLAVYAELSVIINVGAAIGTGEVLILLILTAVVGIWLVRLQGFEVYRRMIAATSRGEAPVDEMIHGILLLLSGLLLIIPGFITDGLGAVLLVPFIRNLIISRGMFTHTAAFYSQQSTRPRESGVIEGEFTSKNNEKEKKAATLGKTDKD